MLSFLQNCLDGLMIGSSYALLAIGFTLIFGVMRRLNLAYGASIMMGIFAGTLLHVEVGAGLWAVAAATVVVAVLAGMYVERLCFWAVRRGVAVASMVSSFAIWMQLEEIVVVVAPERTYPFPPLTEAMPMSLGPFFVRADHLAMFGCALAMVAVLRFVLYRTRFGLIVRAVSENPTAAKAMGIDVGAVAFGAFALASASGGIAGLLIAATDQQITPYFGLWATYKGLIAMMLGGMGSIPGAIAGGLLLGVIEVQGLWYLGAKYRDIIAYLLLFGVLVLRPGGLLGQGLAEKAQAVQRRM